MHPPGSGSNFGNKQGFPSAINHRITEHTTENIFSVLISTFTKPAEIVGGLFCFSRTSDSSAKPFSLSTLWKNLLSYYIPEDRPIC